MVIFLQKAVLLNVMIDEVEAKRRDIFKRLKKELQKINGMGFVVRSVKVALFEFDDKLPVEEMYKRLKTKEINF